MPTLPPPEHSHEYIDDVKLGLEMPVTLSREEYLALVDRADKSDVIVEHLKLFMKVLEAGGHYPFVIDESRVLPLMPQNCFIEKAWDNTLGTVHFKY